MSSSGARDRFAGEIAVVTGAASGMGLATAMALAAEGARVVLIDVNGDGLTAAMPGLRPAYAAHVAIPVDLSDPIAVAHAADVVARDVGVPDVLINAAGVARFGPMERSEPADWTVVVGVDLNGTLHACRYFGALMVARGGGRIVNIASTVGLFGAPLLASYTAAKHGVVGLTKALAVEWARHDVRVNCVCPGATDTPMLATASEEFRRERIRRIPLGRFGRVEEQASAILFLASDDARYVTGAVLPVDGGVSALAPGTSESALWPDG